MVLAEPLQIHPCGIALDDQWVYWTAATGEVWKAQKDGSNVQALVTGGQNPMNVAVDATHVFWVDYGSNQAGATDGVVGKIEKGGAGLQLLDTGSAFHRDLALDAASVFWTVQSFGAAVNEIGKDGAGMQTISAAVADRPFAVAVDTVGVYFSEVGTSGKIQRMDKDGSGLTTLASGQGNSQGLALDQGCVYWTALLDGTVSMVAK